MEQTMMAIFHFLAVENYKTTIVFSIIFAFLSCVIILHENLKPRKFSVYVKGLDGEWHLDPDAKVEEIREKG